MHSRSQSVPEITAAAKAAQERRNRSLSEPGAVYESLLRDIDELMKKVDVSIALSKEMRSSPGDASPQNTVDSHHKQEKPADTWKSLSRPRRKGSKFRIRRRPTIAANFKSSETDKRMVDRTASVKKVLNQIDLSEVSEPQTPALVFRKPVDISADFRRPLPILPGPDESVAECASCRERILPRREKYIEAAGQSYHVDCFKCQICGQKIRHDEPFWQDIGSVRTDGTVEEGLIMCQHDYEWLLNTRLNPL